MSTCRVSIRNQSERPQNFVIYAGPPQFQRSGPRVSQCVCAAISNVPPGGEASVEVKSPTSAISCQKYGEQVNVSQSQRIRSFANGAGEGGSSISFDDYGGGDSGPPGQAGGFFIKTGRDSRGSAIGIGAQSDRGDVPVAVWDADPQTSYNIVPSTTYYVVPDRRRQGDIIDPNRYGEEPASFEITKKSVSFTATPDGRLSK